MVAVVRNALDDHLVSLGGDPMLYSWGGREARIIEAMPETSAAVAVANLSALPRCGFKGWGSAAWLQENYPDLQLPQGPNRITRQLDGVVIARLSDREFFIFADLKKDSRARVDSMVTAGQLPSARTQGCFLLPRSDSHACFGLRGDDVANTLSKLSAIDTRLHRFLDGTLAQTSIARISGIIVRSDLATNVPAFLLFFDSASLEYMARCIMDAAAEVSGSYVGVRQFFAPPRE